MEGDGASGGPTAYPRPPVAGPPRPDRPPPAPPGRSRGRAARREAGHDREVILPAPRHVTALAAAGAVLVLGASAALALAATRDRHSDAHAVAELRSAAQDLRVQLRRERADRRHDLAGLRRRVLARPSVEQAIRMGAAAYGQSPERMRRIAMCESVLDPGNVTGPYVGLFQFGTPLWSQTPFAEFDRGDPYASAFAASWAFAHGWDRHWPVCGRN